GRGFSRAVTPVEFSHFSEQDFHRPCIAHDVVNGEQQHVFFFFQLHDLHSQQWPSAEVEYRLGVLSRDLPGCFLSLFRGQARQILEFQSPRLPFVDYLCRFSFFYLESRSEDLVPSDNLIEASLQRLQIEPSLQPHRSGAVVVRTVWSELIQKPQPLLCKRKRQPLLSFDSYQRRRLLLLSRPDCLPYTSRQTFYRRAFEDASGA